jgi:asparagine synthase (glutamine-hydrolysing)
MGRLYDGEGTYFECIKNLPPAHNLTYENGQISISRYWDVKEFSNDHRPFEEKRSAFKELFLDTINLHLRSDVKLGSCLSGGLDSSSIASAVSHLFPEQRIDTFSIYYPIEGFDEREWITKVTDRYTNLIPTFYSPSDRDLVEHFDDYFKCQELPVGGSSPFSQYFLMRVAKQQGVKVTLDGQGADEYLAGYMYSFYRLMADDVRGMKFGRALKSFRHHAALREYNAGEKRGVLKKTLASVLLNEDRLIQAQFERGAPYVTKEHYRLKDADSAASSSRFDNFLYSLTFHASLPNLLHFEDRNSMAFSLESRVPFLDHRLVEAGFALLPQDRIHEGVTKYILRESMKGIIPDAIYHRQDKKGFNTPGEVRWLRGSMAQLLDLGDHLWEYLEKSKTLSIIEDFKNGNDRNSQLVWRLAMLNRWLKDQ